MAGRLIAAFTLFAAATFLLLFSSGSTVKAGTYDVEYTVSGSDYNPGATTDMNTRFYIPNGTWEHSNYGLIATMSAPPGMWYANDADVPNGAWVGDIVSITTLSLFNMPCDFANPVSVYIPFIESTTDITDTVEYDASVGGENLLADPDGNGYPEYVDHYPSYLNTMVDPDGAWVDTNSDGICCDTDAGCDPPECRADDADGNCCKPPLKPRARMMGHSYVIASASPSLLAFVIFDPEQVSRMPVPEGTFGNSLGYVNYVVLNDPTVGENPDAITDFCSTQSYTLTLGLSAGEGEVIPKVGNDPEYGTMCKGLQIGRNNDVADDLPGAVADDGCIVVTDICGNEIDDDSDTMVDELCAIERVQNPKPIIDGQPTVRTGLYGTGTHLWGTYTQSQRDVDGDTIVNNFDTCPYNADTDPPTDGDGDALSFPCDPNDAVTKTDQDNDGFPNRQDSCPLSDDREGYDYNPATQNSDAVAAECNENAATGPILDDDGDGYYNDGCPFAGGTGPGAGVAESVCAEKACNAGNSYCDDDADTLANEGCAPIASEPTDEPFGAVTHDYGPHTDGIGEQCDTHTDTADGAYMSIAPRAAGCILSAADDTDSNGDADNDNDGWCDSTEDLLGSDKDDPAKTPEYYGIEYDFSPASGAGVCSDREFYSTGTPGAEVNNDGDAGANAADPGCTCNTTNDYDCDGVCDGATILGNCVAANDNCIYTSPASKAHNPEQIDTDGDGIGDACDGDDDNDYALDFMEQDINTKSEDDNPPWAHNINLDAWVDIMDVLLYKPVLDGPWNSATKKYDVNSDGWVDIMDVLTFKPVLGWTSVDKEVLSLTVDSISAGSLEKQLPHMYKAHAVPESAEPVVTLTSTESNPYEDEDVPSWVTFLADVPLGCSGMWLKQGSDIQTKLGWVDLQNAMKQVEGELVTTPLKVDGDGEPNSIESDLHIWVMEPAGPSTTAITRSFTFQCAEPGQYLFTFYNKVLPDRDYKFGDPEKGNNWKRTYLVVNTLNATSGSKTVESMEITGTNVTEIVAGELYELTYKTCTETGAGGVPAVTVISNDVNNETHSVQVEVSALADVPQWCEGRWTAGVPTAEYTHHGWFDGPESGWQCWNDIDDDGDSLVNDGCPKIGAVAETSTECADAVDECEESGGACDLINDGCPAVMFPLAQGERKDVGTWEGDDDLIGGDGKITHVESDVHFQVNQDPGAEAYGLTFSLHCLMDGTHLFHFINKVDPIGVYADPDKTDNWDMVTLRVVATKEGP